MAQTLRREMMREQGEAAVTCLQPGWEKRGEGSESEGAGDWDGLDFVLEGEPHLSPTTRVPQWGIEESKTLI